LLAENPTADSVISVVAVGGHHPARIWKTVFSLIRRFVRLARTSPVRSFARCLFGTAQST
jgi:hypothetical protein